MKYEEAMIFIKDGIKFVQVFAGAIDKSTPHLYLSALSFSPSKSVMAQCLVERFPRIAKVAVGKHDDWPKNQHVLQGHTFSVLSVAFSQDGRHIVSGSHDRTIRVWDAQTGDQVGNPLQGHTDSVWSVAFSQDGRHIVSGSGDRTIQVWDAQTGDQVGNPLQGHTSSVWSVAFSQDERHIVSGSDDRTIRVWDAQTGDQVGNPLQGHTSLVLSVAFSQDGRHIVSGSDDRTIRVWDAQTGNNAGQRTKFTSVKFSSSAAHALHDAQYLFVDTSEATEGDNKDLVHLQADGWIVGPKGKLLLWVPPAYHSFYFYAPCTNLVLPRGGPELDLSQMAHGLTWHQCYTSVPMGT